MTRSAAFSASQDLDAAIAGYLTGLRHTRSVSQVALGEELGRDQSYISKIEHGNRRVSASEAMLWAAALGATFEEFCAGLAPAWLRHVQTSSIWEREEQ